MYFIYFIFIMKYAIIRIQSVHIALMSKRKYISYIKSQLVRKLSLYGKLGVGLNCNQEVYSTGQCLHMFAFSRGEISC